MSQIIKSCRLTQTDKENINLFAYNMSILNQSQLQSQQTHHLHSKRIIDIFNLYADLRLQIIQKNTVQNQHMSFFNKLFNTDLFKV